MPWSPDSIYEQCERECERWIKESEEGEPEIETDKIMITKRELIELLQPHSDDTKIEFQIRIDDETYELESPACNTPQGKRSALISFQSDDIEKLKVEADSAEAKLDSVDKIIAERPDTLSVDDLAEKIQNAIK
jgi:hypothetical protein